MAPIFLALPLALFITIAAQANTEFTPENITKWKEKSFLDNTQYSIATPSGQRASILANSEGTASGLFYEKDIDLNKTPWLSWSWKVDTFPTITDEKTKEGDDFAARVYIVVRDGWTILSTKAISYVWSQQHQEGTAWPNPFTGDKAMMLSVENSKAGEWRTEKRNLKEDLKRLFGKDFDKVDAIAIMTDADNSQSKAVSYYSNLKLSAE